MKKKISIIFGTRPEAIKLFPVILRLKQNKCFDVNICVTAQHRSMLDQVLNVFEITPDIDLNLMQENQTLSSLTSLIINSVDNYFSNYKPDIVIVQGDTTTAVSVSLVAFYHQIKVAHVEAGLRTHNKFSPFPEEMNRVITSKISEYHFVPTDISKKNLLSEGIENKNIFITGNTVIDALLLAKEKVEKLDVKLDDFERSISEITPYILITGHRRENFGEAFISICEAISNLANKYSELNFIYPVHLNPNVQVPVNKILGKQKNIYLLKPQSYLPFVSLMLHAKIVLTDSGGVQEEASSLGKPVLVMRENTERPETVISGTVKLVGTNKSKIVEEVSKLLEDKSYYNKMANIVNILGDGMASERIVQILQKS